MRKEQRNQLLANTPVKKLLPRLAIPGAVAMMVNALYNLTDTIFIGRGVGTDAIGGLAIVFPFQMLVMAAGAMMGIGAASVISRRLGAGKEEEANKAAGTTISVVVFLGLIIIAGGLPLINSILYLFGATEDLLSYAREYLKVVIFGVPFIICAMAGNNIARAEGRAKIAMVSMLLGAGLNILLDPLFIFGFQMGIRGAAAATIISQFFSFLFLALFFGTGKSSLNLRFRHLLPTLRLLREITALGVPAFIRQGGLSILLIVINNTLGFYGGDIYISAYGVISRLLMFLLLPLLGLVQGFQPIAGYNYGAKNTQRVSDVLRLALTITTVYASTVFVLMQGIPHIFVGIFTSDSRLIETATPFLRIVMMFIPLIGLQIIGASFFQAIGKALPAFFLGLSKHILFLIPLALFLPILFGVRGVMYAFPAADILSTIVTIAMLVPTLKKLDIHPIRNWFDNTSVGTS